MFKINPADIIHGWRPSLHADIDQMYGQATLELVAGVYQGTERNTGVTPVLESIFEELGGELWSLFE